MIFHEGEPQTVMSAVDQEIVAVKKEWTGKIASRIYTQFPKYNDAADLAIAYSTGDDFNPIQARRFLSRCGVQMWATLTFGQEDMPEAEPFSVLSFEAKNHQPLFYSETSPFYKSFKLDFKNR